jgi:hypothetical protein
MAHLPLERKDVNYLPVTAAEKLKSTVMDMSKSMRTTLSLLRLVSIALIFHLIGCRSDRAEQAARHVMTEQVSRQEIVSGDVAPGTILLDILESGHPEHYWQYEVQPTAGLVRRVKEQDFRDYAHEDIPHVFLQPAGAIERCRSDPKAGSPDGKFVAYCMSDGIFITDKKNGATLYQWKMQEWRGIRGFAWASNSQGVAILNVSSYYGKSPVEQLSG